MPDRQEFLSAKEFAQIKEFVKERNPDCEVCRRNFDPAVYGWTVLREIGYADAGDNPAGSSAEISFVYIHCELCGNMKSLFRPIIFKWLSLEIG